MILGFIVIWQSPQSLLGPSKNLVRMCVFALTCLCAYTQMGDTQNTVQRPCSFIRKLSNINRYQQVLPLEAVKRLRLRSLKRDLRIPYFHLEFWALRLILRDSKCLIPQHAEFYLILLFSINFSFYCVQCLENQRLACLCSPDFDCKSSVHCLGHGSGRSCYSFDKLSTRPLFRSPHPCHQIYLASLILKPFKGSLL